MTDFKKDTRTAEEQAEARLAVGSALRYWTPQDVYAACITEQVTPRDEFIEELVVAMGKLRKAVKRAPFTVLMDCDNLLTKARERGYDHE